MQLLELLNAVAAMGPSAKAGLRRNRSGKQARRAVMMRPPVLTFRRILKILDPNKTTSSRKTTVQWGGYDADFTQNAAQDFRGCRRRLQLRLDTRTGASRNGAHRPDLRPDRPVCGRRLRGLLDRRADR